jgi:hypothetical protein
MKKTVITIITTFGLALGTTATAATASTTAKLATRSTMTGVLPASSGFAPKCPPVGVVGHVLALTLSGSHLTNKEGAGLLLHKKRHQRVECEDPLAHPSSASDIFL